MGWSSSHIKGSRIYKKRMDKGIQKAYFAGEVK